MAAPDGVSTIPPLIAADALFMNVLSLGVAHDANESTAAKERRISFMYQR